MPSTWSLVTALEEEKAQLGLPGWPSELYRKERSTIQEHFKKVIPIWNITEVNKQLKRMKVLFPTLKQQQSG